MEKIYHVTHIDGDAVGCDVLLKLYHRVIGDDTHIDTKWCSNGNVGDILVEILNEVLNDIFKTTYTIIISDISAAADSEANQMLVDIYNGKCVLHEGTKVNIYMFDHHITNPFIGFKNKDDFVISIDTYQNDKISATKVMLDYIYAKYDDTKEVFNNIIENDAVIKFVNDISRYDTWRWVEEPSENGGEDAVTNALRFTQLDELSYEITNYLLDNITEFGTKHPDNISYRVYLPERYGTMHELVRMEFDKYMLDINKKLKISASGEYLYGLLICDNTSINMSLVSDIINRRLLPGILDYIVILFPTTRSISFRTIKDTVDVSRIAQRCYNGGGHKKAAGAKLDIPTFTSFITEAWTSNSLDNIEGYFSRNNVELNSNNIIKFIHNEF